ncbi:MAG: family 10 glycosylhydrolase [Verrucomicrobiota bacterium]
MFSRIALCGCVGFASFALHAADVVPQPKREFRGGWVASVGNNQWPSKRGLPVEEQKAELIAILRKAEQIKLNAIVLQVRPACDALYASKIEPWSEYLTGAMGQAPAPFYDPLSFAVAEAHKRGLELHAWINPYRAHVVASKSPISSNHISKKYPGMIIPYGKYLWLDPGQTAVQDYTLAVITDIVRRYDIDGLHMDDYFYPYVEKDEAKKNIPFNDDASWQKYQAIGGKLSRGDWRRQSVNTLVARSYQAVKAQKPWVKFGVAPFGIWKPGNPPSTSLKSGNMYEEIYCDSLKWWTNGWVDYLSPQLYWPINPPDQSFTALTRWWSEQNVKGRHLWPGMNTGKVGGTNWAAEEILNQIKATRPIPRANGHIHWSMKSVMNNSGGIADALKALYAEPALVPASPWLGSSVPTKPSLSAKREQNKIQARWSFNGKEKPRWWVFQKRVGATWSTDILPGEQNSIPVSGSGTNKPNTIAISAVNRSGALGPPAVLELKK